MVAAWRRDSPLSKRPATSLDDNPATARTAAPGRQRPKAVLFAMDGAVPGERVKFTADFTQDFTPSP